jgi:hypothetical protein
LERLAGKPVIIHLTATVKADDVAELVRRLDAVAVLADSFRGDVEELCDAVAPVPVLRPIFERRAGAHAGRPEQQFRGYGLRAADGRILLLPDGALAS